MRSDANGKDPDQHSPTLRRYHQLLWSKSLPDGSLFTLDTEGVYTYLRYAGPGGIQYLASDSIVHSYRDAYANRIGQVMARVDPALVDQVHEAGCTVGGYTLFPGTVRGGKPTINGARGMHPRISDRIDLTLECIKRHYEGGLSPLEAALARYADFFALFGDFRAYVDFFLLQDLVREDGGVEFYLPFDDFERSPLPDSVHEYNDYAESVLRFVVGRNRRIEAWARSDLR